MGHRGVSRIRICPMTAGGIFKSVNHSVNSEDIIML